MDEDTLQNMAKGNSWLIVGERERERYFTSFSLFYIIDSESLFMSIAIEALIHLHKLDSISFLFNGLLHWQGESQTEALAYGVPFGAPFIGEASVGTL